VCALINRSPFKTPAGVATDGMYDDIGDPVADRFNR
jgi:hypothetical protein